MAEQEQNRTEPATPFKLREARRRGQVVKSLEVNSLLLLSALLALLYFLGERLIEGQLRISGGVFAQAHTLPLEAPVFPAWVQVLLAHLMGVYWPLMATVVIVAMLANLVQTGPVFSFFPLKPDIQRLNPVNGFKRLFSRKLLFEFVKTLIKLGLFSLLIFLAIRALVPTLLSLVDRPPDSYGLFLLSEVRSLLFKLLLLLLLVALLDLAYSRWDFGQTMRMSRRELKEEIKRREGDPQVRAKLRALQKEAVKRAGALKKVPEADVLITNPAHLAVALRYERGAMTAPQVTAKGAGDLAASMRAVARRHGVPVVENRGLARALFKRVELEQEIPQDLFPAVARVLVWVQALRRRQDAAGSGR